MRIRTVLLAIPAVIVLLAPPAAHAEWYGQSRYRHAPRYASRYAPQHGYYHGGGGGPIVAGALLGLGLGAVIAGAIAPPVVYAPPPVVYEAPPMIYAPSPGYYYGRW